MENISTISSIGIRPRLLRIILISSLIISSQSLIHTPKAEANILSDISVVVVGNIAYDLGKTACGFRCAAAATAATVVVNNYLPFATKTAVEYARPGLFEMFTNWGSTFFHP